jgi:hypothetical protein
MKRIFKYPLQVVDSQKLTIPASSKILSVQNQNEEIVLYALVDDTITLTHTYQIIIHGTGHQADDVLDFNFLGTVSMHGGRLMFHVFTRRFCP